MIAKGSSRAPVFAGATSALALGSSSVEVSWAAATDNQSAANEISYRIYAATTSGGQDFTQPTATTAPGALSATLAGLNASTTYYVVVRAVHWVKKGARLKYMDVRRLETIDGIWTPLEIHMTVKKGGQTLHKTILHNRDVRYEKEIDPALFTLRRLEKGL